MPNVLTVKGIRRLLDGMGDNCAEVVARLSRLGVKDRVVSAKLHMEGSFEEDSKGELVFRGKTTPLPEIPVGVDGGWKREWNREGDGDVVLDYYIRVG